MLFEEKLHKLSPSSLENPKRNITCYVFSQFQSVFKGVCLMKKLNMPSIPLSSKMMNMILSPELRGTAIILGIISVMTFCSTFLLENQLQIL